MIVYIRNSCSCKDKGPLLQVPPRRYWGFSKEGFCRVGNFQLVALCNRCRHYAHCHRPQICVAAYSSGILWIPISWRKLGVCPDPSCWKDQQAQFLKSEQNCNSHIIYNKNLWSKILFRWYTNKNIVLIHRLTLSIGPKWVGFYPRTEISPVPEIFLKYKLNGG
jgi:hypothetical protein